jgi:protoporphyrinogen oxidase
MSGNNDRPLDVINDGTKLVMSPPYSPVADTERKSIPSPGKKAIVIGAGLAGLTAAYRLEQAGWRVLVLEQDDRISGRVFTLYKKGYALDCGPTAVSEGYRTYLALMHELGLANSVVNSSPIIGLVKNGRLHCLDSSRPVSAFCGMSLITWPDKLRLIVGMAKLSWHTRGITLTDIRSHVKYDNESINDFIAHYFRGDLLDYIFNPIARTVTLCDPRNTSCLELLVGLRAAQSKLVNVVGNLEVLPQALAKRLNLQLQSVVTLIEKTDKGVSVSYQNAEGEHKTISADACVVTTPFATAAQLYKPLAQANPALSYYTRSASCYVIHLGYSARTWQNPYVVAIPEKEMSDISAIFLEHNKAPGRAPDGHSLITVYYWTSAVARLQQLSDEEITAEAGGVIERLFPELEGQCDMTNVSYYPRAAHYGSTGYYKILADFLNSHPIDDPIQMAGDYMSIAGQETAVYWGGQAAHNIIQSNHAVSRNL